MRIAITVGMGHIGHQPPGHNGGNNHLKAYSTGTLEQGIFGKVLYSQCMVNVMTFHVNSCSNAWASWRSAVSNPSVNQL
jgi:hypothetical protein